METWSAHQLVTAAEPSLGPAIAEQLRRYSTQLRRQELPVIFSLQHLAKITGVQYQTLHDTVRRRREAANYRMYAVSKRSGGRRFIHAVCGELKAVQQFINAEILQRCKPHPCSYAFHSSGGIRQCAAAHCGARWLFQFDLADFFYDVTEVDVYRIFHGLGYRRLLAFEMARLCTTTRLPKTFLQLPATRRRDLTQVGDHEVDRIRPYQRHQRGVLPQGAPSSPMLANLAAAALDCTITEYADNNGLVYTRYADDITLSARDLRYDRARIRRQVISMIRKCGFRENPNKCRIAGPGSKKVVLGLLVDGESPRASRETYRQIDRLVYGVRKFGGKAAAAHFGFESEYGFRNHLAGLVAFIKSVDLDRWNELSEVLRHVGI
ncbi:MAG: RNA-directed DNA polymerase [Pirellula sp.]|nr:RNA-directed DNA polymerase [Pirellula sp.]